MHHPRIERVLVRYPRLQKLPTNLLLFVFTGGVATIMDWGIFYATNLRLGWHYLTSVTLSSAIGSLTSFSANKYITFHEPNRKFLPQYGVFLIGTAGALLLTYVLLILLIDHSGMKAFPARILVTFLVMFYNFFFHKHVTYRTAH